ncbi:MAG: DUF3179 domain-containing protein [Candidatus Hodarchaeales archaeon]|jgi:hypothetical protein
MKGMRMTLHLSVLGWFLVIVSIISISLIETRAMPFAQIFNPGMEKDEIPAIDHPKFLTVAEFEDEFSTEYLDNCFVLGVVVNREARAYPIDILNWHEIVNDNINSTPFSITYCPLTGSGILFMTSSIEGSTLGTSGNLYENNLVYYDRMSDTSWSQMLGLAIKGQNIGKKIAFEPITETTWRAWKVLYPDTMVLSRDTGFTMSYQTDLFSKYREKETIWAPTSYDSNLSHFNQYFAKELTVVLSLRNETKIYPFTELSKWAVVNDWYKDSPITIFFDEKNSLSIPFNATISTETVKETRLVFKKIDGTEIDPVKSLSLSIFQDQTGTIWNMRGEAISGPLIGRKLQQLPAYNAYWFAAAVFFPNSQIYVETRATTPLSASSSSNSSLERSPILTDSTETFSTELSMDFFPIIASIILFSYKFMKWRRRKNINLR